MTPLKTKDIEDSNFIIFGAGPVGLSFAETLREIGESFTIFSMRDHKGIENKLNYGQNLNTHKKLIGGVGGTAKIWGGQCGFFNQTDFENWKMFELGTDFEEGEFSEAIEICSGYMQLDLGAIEVAKSLDSNKKIVNTIYPENIKISDKFGQLIRKNRIYHIDAIKSYTEEKDLHIINFINDTKLEIPKQKIVVFALGAVGNLDIYRKSSFLKDIDKGKVGVLDHLSLYPLEFEPNRNYPNFSNMEFLSSNRIKNKYYFAQPYQESYEHPILIQQGIVEFHPMYKWNNQSTLSTLANLGKRITNYISSKLRLDFKLKPKRYRAFMQIEQCIEEIKYVKIDDYKDFTITEFDLRFIKSFISHLKEILSKNNIKIISENKIEGNNIPTLFQAFHPSSVFQYPFKAKGQPSVNFDGRPKDSTNINFVGSCCFPTPGWINPTLMAMSHATYVARRLGLELKNQKLSPIKS